MFNVIIVIGFKSAILLVIFYLTYLLYGFCFWVHVIFIIGLLLLLILPLKKGILVSLWFTLYFLNYSL